MERERKIKKFMVTKSELLNNLSDIYKCKVSLGGTFSLGNFLFDERELSGLIGVQREKILIFSSDKKKSCQKRAFARHIHVYLSIGSIPPPPGAILAVILGLVGNVASNTSAE